MIATGAALTELPGLVFPENISRRLRPQTPREEAMVDLIETLLDLSDPEDMMNDINADELERLSALEIRFIQGNAMFKAGLDELKMVLCQVSTDHEKVAHMTQWLFRQRANMSEVSPMKRD